EQPRDSATAAYQTAYGSALKQRLATVAGDGQTLLQVTLGIADVQRSQPVREGDALAQLAKIFASQGCIELRLAEQHDLQQLAVFGLQIGQQAQGFQRGGWQCLRLVDQQHAALALPGQFDQTRVQGSQQAVVVQLLGIDHMQLMGQRLAQRQRIERRVRQPGQLVAFRVQLVEQRAAQQRLAGANLARHLDQALALRQRHAQQIEASLVRRQLDHEAGIRSQREGLLAQAEECLVHVARYLADRKDSELLRNSSSQTWSLTTCGRMRMTSSVCSSDLRCCWNRAPAKG